MADVIAAPSNQPSISTPRITVNDGRYTRVGDFDFGNGNKPLVADPDSGINLDQARAIREVERRTENKIREVLERDGLHLHRQDNWIKVMNRCKKNLYEIYRFQQGDRAEFHLFRKGKLFVRIVPWVDMRNHMMFLVESC